ncbi:MAG TPA: hypothetical protein VF883_14975 [Thermoanaerobaculia bacterium]|jgi:hypothetical protein
MNRDDIVIFPGDGDEPEHLTYEELEAWLDGRAGRIDRELAEGHLALCARCRAEADDLRRVRESLAPRRPAWWIAAAAAVLIAILGIAIAQRRTPVSTPPGPVEHRTETRPAITQPAPSPRKLVKPEIVASLVHTSGTLRGTGEQGVGFALQEPVATVVLDPRPPFRWTAMPGAGAYTVAVADRETGAGAATGETQETFWRPPAPLQRGRTYSWQVTAHVGDERRTVPRATDAEALFHVATEEAVREVEAVAADQHLELGLALAEHGALDDAERELRRAVGSGAPGAELYLEEVRSWRQR